MLMIVLMLTGLFQGGGGDEGVQRDRGDDIVVVNDDHANTNTNTN